MRFKLVEDFGESEELNTFAFQLASRFKRYYRVEIAKGVSVESVRYFAYEEAARNYYNKMLDIFNADKDLYDNTEITLDEVEVKLDYNELESYKVDKDL